VQLTCIVHAHRFGSASGTSCGDPRDSFLRSAERYLRPPLEAPLVAQERRQASERSRDALIRCQPEESREAFRGYPKERPVRSRGSVREQIPPTSWRFS
jgi:hypothetical protein